MTTNDLALPCPCSHPAYLHRTAEQTADNLARGVRHVGVCNGGGIGGHGPACSRQVDRASVIAAAKAGDPVGTAL